jgi:hypothetical protein
MDRYYFVWINTPWGPTPQVWHFECFEVAESRLTNVLARHLLADRERDIGLDQLATRYPLE